MEATASEELGIMLDDVYSKMRIVSTYLAGVHNEDHILAKNLREQTLEYMDTLDNI